MSGFFGFSTELPERRGSSSSQRFPGFPQNNADQSVAFNGAEEEDLAVYDWEDGMNGNLLEGGDDLNDETFGGLGDVGEDCSTTLLASALSHA